MPLSECPIGQASLSVYRTPRTKKPDVPPRRKVIQINGLKKSDSAGQLRTNAIGARRTVVVCPYRADNCPAPNLVLLGMVYGSVPYSSSSMKSSSAVLKTMSSPPGPLLTVNHAAIVLDSIGRHQSLCRPLECLAEGVSLEGLAIPASRLATLLVPSPSGRQASGCLACWASPG